MTGKHYRDFHTLVLLQPDQLLFDSHPSSLRLFSVDSSGPQMIRNFSLRQRLHLLLELLYGKCDERMCPLDRNCLQSSIIYQGTVPRKDNNTTEKYIGLTENDFKTRYRSHTASFLHAKHKNSTELSKHIWTLKDKNMEYFTSHSLIATRHTIAQVKDVTSASKKNS